MQQHLAVDNKADSHPGASNTQPREWQEYLIEAWALGCFMISIGMVVILLEAPVSSLHNSIQNETLRRVFLAAAMALTAVGLIYSPWGQRSGAHMNPAVTLAFLRLHKISLRHALGYIVAQMLGGVAGIYLVWIVFGATFSSPPISFVTTVPSDGTVIAAFFAELFMSALLMLMLLVSIRNKRLAPYTGLLVGVDICVHQLGVAAPGDEHQSRAQPRRGTTGAQVDVVLAVPGSAHSWHAVGCRNISMVGDISQDLVREAVSFIPAALHSLRLYTGLQ